MKDPSGTNQELLAEPSILKQRIKILGQSEAKRREVATFSYFLIPFMIAVILFVGGLVSSACNAADNSTEVHVGSEIDFPPYAFVDKNGRPGGFSVELIKAVTNVMSLSIKISTGSWDTVWNSLVSGQLDVLPIVAKLPERQSLVDFSLPHTETYDAFFVRQGDPPIQNIAAAQGMEIVVMRSDAAHHALLERNFQGKLILVDMIPAGLKLISSGKHDAFLCSKLIGTLSIKEHGITGLTAGPIIPDYKRVFSFAVKKGNTELMEKLNQGLLLVKTSGEYNRIYDKWLSFDDPWRKVQKYLLPAIIAVIAIAVIAGFWLVLLQILIRRRTRELAQKNERLRLAYDGVEARIQERTMELTQSHNLLQAEITERKRAQEELQASEERYRSYMEVTGQIGWVTNADGEIVEDVPSLRKFSGQTYEEAKGSGWANSLHPDDLERVLQVWNRAVVAKSSYEIEYRMRRHDGVYRNLLARGFPVFNENGIIREWVGTCIDITERKRVEEALRESEERFRLAINATKDGIWEWDIKTNQEYFSPRWREIIGYSFDDPELPHTYDSWASRIHSDDYDHVIEAMKNHLENGAEYNVEYRHRHKSGKYRWLNSRGQAIFDESGKPIKMVGCISDINERKQAEQILTLEHAVNRGLANAMNGAEGIRMAIRTICEAEDWESGRYFRVDDKAGVMRCTEAWGIADPAVTGYINASLGRSLPLERGLKGQVWKTGKPLWGSNTSRHEYLSEKHLGAARNSFAFPIIAEGKVIGIVSCTTRQLRDPDELLLQAVRVIGSQIGQFVQRKEAEEALRERKEFTDSLIASMQDGFSVLDSHGVQIDVNPAFCQMTGFSREELIGVGTPHRYWPPEASEEIEKGFQKTLRGDFSDLELTFMRKNGERFPVIVSPSCVKDKQGNVISYFATVKDITDRKRMEEEKRSMEERLQRSEKMEAMGLLAGGVAHDLNNVLGIVVGYAEMLLMDTDKLSSVRPILVNIMKGGQKAAKIVDDLLTLARRGVSDREVLNLNKIVSACQQSQEFEKLYSFHHSLKIKTDLEPDLLNISGSSVHLEKTLFNLVSNACEAMVKGGIVTIKTANQYLDKPIQGYDQIRAGDYVVLSVSDTGEGIHEANLKRIFEPFYTKKVMGRSGTGLGLAVVWGTVKDHNGYINVQSEEGKGSTFTLYFPVTREDLTAEAVAIAISEYMGQGESILVVDDVKEQRDLAAGMLRTLNYNVSSVSSGEEAVAYMKEHEVDLMVLDMIMDPGMDGLDTYKQVLDIHPQQKAIIVSGFSETEQVKAAQALGVGSYVRKPYIKEKLGLAVRNELDRS